MLILLPLAAFAVSLMVILGEDHPSDAQWREAGGAFLRAAVLWGTFVALSSELLSLVQALTRVGVALSWLAALTLAGGVGWRRGSLRRGLAKLRALPAPTGAAHRGLLAGMAVVAGSLLLVAWMSPPNTVDSLQYHMSRVAHWAQQRSLAHYATAYGFQLYNSIWAEEAILHLRLLWGSDQPANLVQWFSMIGGLVGSLTLASYLGASKAGAWLAAAFAISIPMGVLQATSTQNDYVTALWVLCTAFLVVRLQSMATVFDRICLALALGLGVLTKAPFYVFAPLLVLWYSIARWRGVGLRKMALEGLAIASLMMIVNLGFWARNLRTFGSPYGPLEGRLWIAQVVSGRDRTPAGVPSDEGGTAYLAEVPARYLAKFVRTVAFHLVTPIGYIKSAARSALSRFSSVFDESFLDQWDMAAWNHEDTAGNPFHFGLLLGAAVLLLLRRREDPGDLSRPYTLAVLGSFLLLVLAIDDRGVVGIRYQLPFFVLAGPFVGLAFSRPGGHAVVGWLSWLILLLALPWLLFNNTRPLIGWKPWPTRIGSVLTIPSAEIAFAANPKLLEPYRRGTEIVTEVKCTHVGLRIDSHDLEYLFWWLLRAPQSGVRIESVYFLERFRPLVDPSFQPCAILCTICGDRERLHGLPRAADLGDLAVFLGPGYVADPDG